MKIRIFVANTGVILMLLLAFLSGYMKCENIPVYAAVDDDPIYVPLREQSDLVTAFQAYCKSRDLTIEGSLTDAVTTFTTGAFNSACNEIGINIPQLQAEIKAEYDQSGKPIKFLYNTTGVGAMNRIFAQFLQDNELEVGDTDVNKTVYDGKYSDGSLVYIINSTTDSFTRGSNYIQQRGSFYLYTTNDIVTIANKTTKDIPYTYSGGTFNLPVGYIDSYDRGFKGSDVYTYTTNRMSDYLISGNNLTIDNIAVNDLYAYVALCYNIHTNKYYYAFYNHYYIGSELRETVQSLKHINVDNVDNVTITINSITINNNNYEGDTYITNEGDVINPGGGGGDNPGGGGSGGDDTNIDIDFPNINFPNIPEINFQLSGLNTKFPFCIPFDMVALLQLLNAEPEAPRIQGDIPISNSITWHLDMNFEQFDWFATIMRGLEFVGFIFFLVGATINIAKG